MNEKLSMQKIDNSNQDNSIKELEKELDYLNKQTLEIKKDLKELRKHIDNGFKKELVDMLVNSTNATQQQIMQLVQVVNENQTRILYEKQQTKRTMFEQIGKSLIAIGSAGGVLFLLIDKFLS